MKRVAVLVAAGLIFLGSPAWGHIFVRVHSIDDYVKLGKTILIVECVFGDDHPIYANVLCRKVRILEALRGSLKKEQRIYVLTDDDLMVGHAYLIYSGQDLDEKGDLNAYSYHPGTIPIVLSGEVPRAEKEQRIAAYLRTLNELSLKDELLYILRQRRSAFDYEIRDLQSEKELFDGLLPK